MSEEKEKIVGINWSPFLIRTLTLLLGFLTIPHVLFWIPAWIQLLPLNIDLGWDPIYSLILNFLFLAFCVGFIFYYYTKFDLLLSRFIIETISDVVTFERIEIPIGGGHFLPGDIIRGPLTPKENAPVIILCHGLGGQRTDFYTFGIPLSFMGFACILYDSRGHGENEGVFGQKWDTFYIIRDLDRVVDYIEKRADEVGDLDANEIIAWGASMGGGIVLNSAYLDRRIKFIIALCTWADFQFTATRKLRGLSERLIKLMYEMMGVNLDPSNMQNRLVSPIYNSFNKKKGFFSHPVYWEVDNDYRVAGLAHCKDDQVVHYKNYEMNSKFLKMPRVNTIAFENGNHAFAGNESAVVGKMLLWFWMRGY